MWRLAGSDPQAKLQRRLVRYTTSPSVNVQSAPRFTAASNHANAGLPSIKEKNQTRKPPLDYFGSPCKEGLNIFAHETNVDFSVNVLPFLCCTQLGKQGIELSLMDWRELEPIEKIERFIF